MLWRDPIFWVETLWTEMQSVRAFNLHGKPAQMQLGWMGSTLSRESAGFQNLPLCGTRADGSRIEARMVNVFTFRHGRIATKMHFAKIGPPYEPLA